MNVKLATQVYSNDVSTAFLTLSNLKKSSSNILKKEAHLLATFIKKMNDLFDCINSITIRDPNSLRRPLSRKNNEVEQTLRDALTCIDTWKMSIPELKPPPTFISMKITLTAVL